MLKLNDNNIEVGHIKQLLNTFNLPLCRVGRSYPSPNRHFLIKDNIKRWDENLNEHFCASYVFGKEYKNLTSNLKIQNIFYDRDTHRYLGKYLRFYRDYFGLNLMSMYNCYDGDLNFSNFGFKIKGYEENDSKYISFLSGADNMLVYKIPISLWSLTISVHSLTPVEMCLYIDTANEQLRDINQLLGLESYIKRKCESEIYYNPNTYLKRNDALRDFVFKYLDNLYLLLRVPQTLSTSIVVLEGTYQGKGHTGNEYFTYRPYGFSIDDSSPSIAFSLMDTAYTPPEAALLTGSYSAREDAVDTSFGEVLFLVNSETPVYADNTVDSGYKIVAQLLSHENETQNALIGDRLIEYLTQNAISNINNPYEIKRVQKSLDLQRYNGFGTAFANLKKVSTAKMEAIVADKNLIETNKNIELDKIKKQYNLALYGDGSSEQPGLLKTYGIELKTIPNLRMNLMRDRHYGIWHYSDFQDLRALIYKNNLNLNYDTLGYLDKDVEKTIKEVLDNAV